DRGHAALQCTLVVAQRPGLQADEAQHAERKDQHRDQDFDQSYAALTVAQSAPQVHVPVPRMVLMRLLLPSVSVRMLSVATLVEHTMKACGSVSSPLSRLTTPPTSAPPVRASPSGLKAIRSLSRVE